MKVGSKIKSMCYSYHAKEILALNTENFLTFYKSDGRLISNSLSVDLLQDTSNKFVKYSVPNKIYDNITYCSKDRQFIGWKAGEKEINVSFFEDPYPTSIIYIIFQLFSTDFELLSVAKSFEPIDALGYNSKTGDLVTCSSNSEVIVRKKMK
jgi:hypothetical protein